MARPHLHSLPGGGPWMILESCPSEKHNTQRAAILTREQKRAGLLPCHCPRGLEMRSRRHGAVGSSAGEMALLREHRSQRAALAGQVGQQRKREKYRAAHPLWEVGGAPYRVLAECKVELHNTRASWRAGCICPQAVKFRSDDNARQRERNARAEQPQGSRLLPVYVLNIVGTMPSLPDAACKEGEGQAIMNDAVEASDSHTLKLGRAVDFCVSQCKAFFECRAAVTRLEQPAGAWDGVYGGLTPQDRRDLAKSGGQG